MADPGKGIEEPKEEIVMFWEMKDIQCDFSVHIVDEEWRSDFKFTIDFMKMMNKLNVKLQAMACLHTRCICMLKHSK